MANGHTSRAYNIQSGQLAPPAPPPPQGLGPAGQKALLLRARKELAPLEDPTQPIAD